MSATISSENTTDTDQANEQKRKLSWPKLLAWVGLLLTLAAPAIKGWRVYRSATALQTRIESIQAHAESGLGNLDAATLEGEILGLRSDAQMLHAELAPLVPYASWFTWVPRVGDLMPVTPELLRLLDHGTLIGADLGVNLLPILPILQDDSTELEAKVPEILAVIDRADGSLERTAALWPIIHRDLNKILDNPAARDALPWQLRQQLPTIEPLLPLVDKGITTMRILPEVGAINGRRSYLIVGQNSDELRPTGGFLSMTMAVGLENGQLRGTKITDANNIDNYFEKPYGDPPAAMREFMGNDLFLFRDSNYWPDFPTSSYKMIDLYSYGTGLEIDGLIAFDIRFISRLIGAIGPVEIPELEFTLTGDNTLGLLEQAWGAGLDTDNLGTRRDFLGAIAVGLGNHVQSDQFNPDIAALATILDESLRDKSLQVFIDGEDERIAFAQMGVDGVVTYDTNEDLLLLTESNVGFNKSNRLVEGAIDYQIDLGDDGSANAKLTLSWTHEGNPGTDICEVSYFAYTSDLQYSDMIQDCNWNHLRVYTPAGSQLIGSGVYPIEAEKMPGKAAWAGETRELTDDLSGFTVFENLRLLPAGKSSDFEISYQLDSVVTINPSSSERVYRLNLVRQAGVYPYPPTTVTVTLPENTSLISASLEPAEIDGNTITFSTVLSEDRFIEVIYR